VQNTEPVQNNDLKISDAEKKLEDLERFIARRFDEISMEIEATSQLIEMGEEDAQKRFSDMLGAMHAITFSGDGSTAANSGAELEAVIKETEDAANQIMDSIDRISNRIQEQIPDKAGDYDADIQAIILACSFQDLTSQRVTMALQTIRGVEERMTETLKKFGITIQESKEKMADPSVKAKDDFIPESGSSQNDIDALFD
jgi:chemotaxis protein CheZ